MELISIIIPAFNAEKTILNALNSILHQNYEFIEVLVVINGPSDKTESIVKIFSKNNKKINFHLIKSEIKGVSHARNLGIKFSKGKYIYFMDSDDYLEDNAINCFLKHFGNNTDLVCSGYYCREDKKKIIFREKANFGIWSKNDYLALFNELQSIKGFNVVWNKVYSKKIIEKNNLKFDEKISMGEDLVFNIDYFFYCKKNIVLLDKCLYNYLISKDGLQSKNNVIENIDLYFSELKKLDELYKLYGDHNYIYLEVFKLCYVYLSKSCYNKKVFEENLRNLLNYHLVKDALKLKIDYPFKYAFFLNLLKLRKYNFLRYLLKAFDRIKFWLGKNYNWN